MPKPPSFTPEQVDELLEASSARDRVRALERLAPERRPLPELVLEVAARVGERCSGAPAGAPAPVRGPVPAPAAVVGMAGAVELLPALGEDERGLALLQATAGAAAEGLGTAPGFAGWPWSHALGNDASMADMDRSVVEGALTRFHGRLVPFLNEETRRKHGHRYLYTRSVLDLSGDGWRHVLAGRSLRLGEALGWRRCEQVLLALSHYFVHAEPDYAEAEALQGFLDSLGKDIPGDNRGRKPALEVERKAEAEGLLGEPLERRFASLLDLWSKGYSLEAVAEPLLFAAASRVGAAAAPGPSAGGEGGRRALLFVASSFAAFPWLRGHDGMVQVLMGAALLGRLFGGEPVAAGGPAARAARSGTAADLEAALAGGDGDGAAALALGPGEGDGEATVAALARRAVARDAVARADLEDLGLVPALVDLWRRSQSPDRGRLLAALARLLARPGGTSLADAWRR
jgi:hypothetical protein